MPIVVPCVWKAPFTAYHLLELLTPTGGSDQLYSITPDGQTVVGSQPGADGWAHAVKWDTTTFAITQLEDVVGTSNGQNGAGGISADGSVIWGSGVSLSTSLGGLTRWSGSAGAQLTLPTPYTQSAISTIGPNPLGAIRPHWTDDGTIVVGKGAGPTTSAPGPIGVKWTSGTPAQLLSVVSPTNTNSGAFAYCMSKDGAIVVGQSISYLYGTQAAYWTGTTARALAAPSGVNDDTFLWAHLCNGDGSIIWGSGRTIGPYPDFAQTTLWWYWDGITTITMPDSILPFYGTPHILPALFGSTIPAGFQTHGVAWAADDIGSHTVVGFSLPTDPTIVAPGPANYMHAVRWTGTTITDLGSLGAAAQATCCNHDGSIVCGNSGDSAGNSWPVWWDATNTLRTLPTPMASDSSQLDKGGAIGISRDGSVIYGWVYVPSGSTPPPSSLALDNVVAFTEAGADSELVFLDWSDDRGHSWSNAIGQLIGDRGDYLTNCQWQRLGMARDRVFRLTWSAPVATALQGAFIEADTSAKS